MPDHTDIDASLGIYNPASLPPDILLAEFIARRPLLEKAVGLVRDNLRGQPQQHLLLLGPRGIGKTTFLRALAYTVERDADLATEWVPVVFPEETYGIGDLADFWLEATEQLLHSVGRESGESEVEALRESNPEDIEELAKRLFLRLVDATGKRVLLGIENLNDFFAAVSDTSEQHRLRAFLMEDDRVMLAATATSYFDATGNIDLPFYDFFRIIRLERLTADESAEVLSRLAELRDDPGVADVVRDQPERIRSLHVLTGGNPRLLKMIYRLLKDGIEGDARSDLNRLLEDCTPYFKSRIEEISAEERRVFDHVARHWDPVAVGDIQSSLRRPSNKISIYLRRLVDSGFLEEAPASTQKRKVYQVAERFYNIYYLMRFTRSSRRRLEWLVQAMRVIYSPDDFRTWTEKTLAAWQNDGGRTESGEREAFLHALTMAPDSSDLRKELIGKTLETAWTHDQLQCLDQLLDRELAKATLGGEFDLIEFFARLPESERTRLGYHPDQADWWIKLTEPLENAGRYQEAEQAYRKAISIVEADATIWTYYGHLLQDHLHRFDAAEEAYRKAISLTPDNAAPWNNLGIMFVERFGKTEDAENAFRNAIRANEEYAYAWHNLGTVLRAKFDRSDEAESAFRNAIRIDPSFAMAWNGLGNLCADLRNDFEGAEIAYHEAIKVDPNYVDPWNGLGNLFLRLNRPDESEKAFKSALRVDPFHAYPHAGLSDLYASLRRFAESAQHALQAGLLDPAAEWPRNQFLKICGEDPKAWLQVLPKVLDCLNATTVDPGLTEMAIRGFEFVLSRKATSAREVLSMIEAAGNPEPVSIVTLALRSLDEPGLLDKVSPEVRTVAKDFVAKISSPPTP